MVGQPADQHIGQNVQPINEVELLEDHRAIAPPFPQAAAAQCGDIGRAEADRAFRRLHETVNKAQESGLLRAGRADHPDELARRYVECHPVDSPGLPERAAERDE